MHFRRWTFLLQFTTLVILVLWGLCGIYLYIYQHALFKYLVRSTALFPLLFLVQFVPRALAHRRYVAAQKMGLILCSSCEYPIPFSSTPTQCPECGCVRSGQEHQKMDENWRFWVK
jgi:hypothetical protein